MTRRAVSCTRLEIAVEQKEKRTVVASLSGSEATITQDGPDRIRIQRTLNKSSVPGLQSGPARIVVIAARPVVYGIRTVESSATRDVTVRLEPPRASVISTHHYVNHGGTELVVYRVNPPDVSSGVRVGDVEYPGYPASGAGALAGKAIADPALHVAFFALLHDQELKTPMHVFARDEAGNTARADFDHRVFPKPFRRSRIELDDSFIGRVVPAILERTPDLKPDGDDLAKFLTINRDLRRQNAETIAKLGSQTAKEALWTGPFQQLGNSKVESAFADHRTVLLQGARGRSADPSGIRPRRDGQRADRGGQSRPRGIRGLSRYLRQLRHRRSRAGHPDALRPSLVVRNRGRADGREGADPRPERDDRARRRRSPALHAARPGARGQPGGVVGFPLARGPGAAEAARFVIFIVG